MNNEIKEILERLEKYGQLTPDAIDDLHYIKDYITNLQQENERLNNHYEYKLVLKVRIKRLEQRIDKAVEFIRMHDLYHPTNEFRLLCILKGEDK